MATQRNGSTPRTAEHTPGPWRALDRIPSGPHVASSDLYDIFAEDAARPLAYARESTDARLIAAAPDLLRAARNLALAYDVCVEHDAATAWLVNHVADLRAAIAKAEGR